MHFSNRDITYFGKTNFRSSENTFGIYQADRFFHTIFLGQTGTGKSTTLKTMIYQDIHQNRGFCLIEPHGDLVKSILELIPKERKKDLVYIDVTDTNLKIGYNPIRKVSFEKRALVASSILDGLKKLWADSWGNKIEHILRFVMLALLDQPSATMADIHKIMFDKSFRYRAVQNIVSPAVKDFWKKEYPKYTNFDLMPIMNKIGAFLAYPSVRRVLIDNEETISLRSIMDDGKILIINLNKGEIGNDPCHILGGLLLTSLTSAAFSRTTIEESDRRPFFIYVDEQQNFASLSIINMLSELRKFKIGLILANQYFFQLEKEVRHSIMGNVGTKIFFRVGHDDARLLSGEMKPYFDIIDLMYLPNYHINLILMINGTPSHPFSAKTLPLDHF